MTKYNFSANFGTDRGGLGTVQYAFYDTGGRMGSWSGTGVHEIAANTGAYGVYVEVPSGALLISWRDNQSAEKFSASALERATFVFSFGRAYASRTVGYIFYDENGAAITAESSSGVHEIGGGVYYAITTVPAAAVWVRGIVNGTSVYTSPESIDLLSSSESTSDRLVTHRDDIINIFNSLRYHLKNYQFSDNGTLTTLTGKYSGLNFKIAYPDRLQDLCPPVLAIDHIIQEQRASYTWNLNREFHNMIIYGFCGGQNNGEKNTKQLYQLMSDVKGLFDPNDQGVDYINLYDYSSGSDGNRTKLDTIQIRNVTARRVSAGYIDTLDVSKYRFAVSFSVGLFKSQ